MMVVPGSGGVWVSGMVVVPPLVLPPPVSLLPLTFQLSGA